MCIRDSCLTVNTYRHTCAACTKTQLLHHTNTLTYLYTYLLTYLLNYILCVTLAVNVALQKWLLCCTSYLECKSHARKLGTWARNSAFHPSGVGKWVPASAGKAKAGMVHSVSGWTRGVQVKLWDPLRTHAIPERYTNSRLPLPYLYHGERQCAVASYETYSSTELYQPCNSRLNASRATNTDNQQESL